MSKLEQYGRVHVVAYSFGSIVAFNAFFPRSRLPLRRFASVDTLVFIGSPFDTIRSFWPKYFRDRKYSANVPKRWVNVFRMDDIMSSNFDNNRQANTVPSVAVMHAVFSSGPPTVTEVTSSAPSDPTPVPTPVNVPIPSEADDREFNLVETISLYGFAAHTGYWHSGNPQAQCAFDEVVANL